VTHPHRPTRRTDAGFSLVELLVTVVVMLAVLATVTQIVVRSNIVYGQQRDHLDQRYNTAASVEMMVRLLRQAESIAVDPDGNNQLDSIGIVADWNPRDGDTTDPYENIVFSRDGSTLMKREAADAAPIAFADNIQSLQFAYFNPAGGSILTPTAATQSQLAFVTVTVEATGVDGQPGAWIQSSASIRRLE
jgi:prepilin-type N-terminal cleavage/methylation domain-containing protein